MRAIQICIVFEGLWLDIQIGAASPRTLIYKSARCPCLDTCRLYGKNMGEYPHITLQSDPWSLIRSKTVTILSIYADFLKVPLFLGEVVERRSCHLRLVNKIINKKHCVTVYFVTLLG